MPSLENQLLAYCTHNKLSPSSRQDIQRLLQSSLDWEELMAAASWHAVMPLLYRCLRDDPDSKRVPQAVMQQLKKAYDDIAVRNMYIYASLSRVLPRFKEQDIKCLVLKGALLADVVYGDIALRPMQDIDLLFNKTDLPSAISIFSELGYLFEGGKSPQFYLDNHNHITYTHPDMDIPVELHWHISNDRHPRRLRLKEDALIEQWFKRARPVTLSGTEAWTLCPTDMIFHLCMHFLKHRVPRNGGLFTTSAALLQLSDMARVLDHYGDEIDWDDLRQLAERYRISDLIFTTIRLALEVCNDKDSSNSLLLKIPEVSSKYRKLMYQQFMEHHDMTRPIPDGLVTSIGMHDLRGFLRAVVRWLLPARETLSERYSVPETSKRMYVYFLLNPYNLIKTVLLFLKQLPRLSDEMRLHRWIGG